MEYIAIMCAMRSEAQPLIDKLQNKYEVTNNELKIYTGKFFDKDILICVSGVGMVNMAFATAYVLTSYNVKCLFNYGIIGGYGTQIHKGDLLLVKDCININSTQYEPAPKGAGTSLNRAHLVTFSDNIDNAPVIYKSDDTFLTFAQSVLNGNIVSGRLGSGDVWNKEYDKILLFFESYGVLGEDMEGYAMYQVADKFSVPALSLKGVSNNEILGEKYDYSVMENLIQSVCKLLQNWK